MCLDLNKQMAEWQDIIRWWCQQQGFTNRIPLNKLCCGKDPDTFKKVTGIEPICYINLEMALFIAEG